MNDAKNQPFENQPFENQPFENQVVLLVENIETCDNSGKLYQNLRKPCCALNIEQMERQQQYQ